MWLTNVVLCVMNMALLVVAVSAYNLEEPLEIDEVIETVNSANTTWTAKRNFHSSLTSAYTEMFSGIIKPQMEMIREEYVPDYDTSEELPVNFDAREKWPFCKGLQTAKNQGQCGSCWAVSSASAFTNRLCIATNGSWNSQLSSQYLLTCSGVGGCYGGWPDSAFAYFELHGIITGGDYGSEEGCQPYLIPPCDPDGTHGYKYCGDGRPPPPPTCEEQCSNEDYKTPIEQDYYRVNSTFKIIEDVTAMQREIYMNGPLVSVFAIYQDLYSYKSGVYQYTTGFGPGLHAAEIIGWGEEDGTPYWLVMNSWGSDWGDQGTVKFLRGSNHCGIESSVVGALIEV